MRFARSRTAAPTVPGAAVAGRARRSPPCAAPGPSAEPIVARPRRAARRRSPMPPASSPRSTGKRSRPTPTTSSTCPPAVGSASRSEPRAGDRWTVGGEAPRALPEGRLSGRDLRGAAPSHRAEATRSGRASPTRLPASMRPSPIPRTRSRPTPPRTPATERAVEADAIDPARRDQPQGPPPRDLRLPAVLGADRQLDDARLRQDLDDRLLRRRGRGERHAGADQQGRLHDRRLERLDELEADQRHQRRAPEPHPGRADRAELRLVERRRDQAEGAPGQRDGPDHPGQADRGGRPGPRRGRRQPRLRAARGRLRRRVRLAREARAHRARCRGQGLPAHVRHDRLHRQLPDRSGHRGRRRRCDLRHGLRLPIVGLEPGRLDRPDRRAGLRHHRHGQGLRRARAGVQAHPRRPVLRPRLVHGQLEPQRRQHQRHEVRRIDHGHLRHRHRRPPGARPQVRHPRGRGLDGLPPPELHRRPTAA